jgi:protein tyrosine phosphatase
MVWEQNSSVIVMLTKLKEGGKKKCWKYWPVDEKEQEAGAYLVKFVDEVEVGTKGEITLRTFVMETRKEVKVRSREIYHLHYTGWDDHDVPMMDSFKECLQLFYQYHSRVPPHLIDFPIVVHCSAGIGRTGSFIVTDLVLRHCKFILSGHEDGGPAIPCLDLPTLIYETRKQRLGLVQAKEQFKFIYDFLKWCMEHRVFGLDISNETLVVCTRSGFEPSRSSTGGKNFSKRIANSVDL